MDPEIILLLQFVFVSHVRNIAGLYTVDTKCNSTGFCLVVYGTDMADGITWDLSRDACESENADLASIPDLDVQSLLETVLGNVSVLGDVPGSDGVWVGGRRSDDNTWRLLDGSPLSDSLQIEEREAGYCVFLELKDSVYTYVRDNCDEHQGNSRPLCQFPNKGGMCNFDSYHGFKFADTCYYVHSEQSGRKDWYDAQTFCYTQLGGDLAHSHIDNSSLLEILLTENEQNLWIGLQRYSWQWETGSPVRYYSWDDDMWPTREFHTNNQMWIRLDKGTFTWMSDASAKKLHYFLCQYVNESVAITSTTQVLSSNARATTEAISTSDELTTSYEFMTTEETTMGDDERKVPVIAIAVSVTAVVIVVVIVTVLLVLRKRKHGAKPHTEDQSVNSFDDHVPQASTSHPPEDIPESGYTSVVDNPQYESREDLVQPYGEFSPSPSRAARLKNRVSGLFQGAFMKAGGQDNQPGVEDTTHDQERAIYAQPNKPKKTSTGASKKPSIKTAKPKLKGAKKATSPEVAHVEAPTGDIYAVSMKNVL